MNTRTRFRVVGIAAAFAAGAVHAQVPWRSDWYVQAPQTLDTYTPVREGAKPSAAVAFGADGEVVIAAATLLGDDIHVTRRRDDGSVRWSANIGVAQFDDAVYAIRAEDDGGATVALGSSYSDWQNRLARVDAGGDVRWLRAMPTGWMVASGMRLVTAGCAVMTVLDAASGNTVWQRRFDVRDTSCTRGGIGTDATGNIYALHQLGDFWEPAGYRVVKFDPQGATLWSIHSGVQEDGDLVGVGAGLIYVRTETGLTALHAADGSLAWSVYAGTAQVVLSDDAERAPIVVGPSRIRRLAADTGSDRWTAFIADTREVSVLGASLVIATPTSRLRLDAASGDVLWNVPDNDVQTTWLGFGDAGAGTLRAIGRPWLDGPLGSAVMDRRLDIGDGSIVDEQPTPMFAQGVRGMAMIDAQGHVVEVGVAQHAQGTRLVRRRVDSVSGATLWEGADPIDELAAGEGAPYPRVAVAHGSIVAATTGRLSCAETAPSWTQVSRYAVASGARHWSITLRDVDQYCAYMSTPAIDAGGNVFASIMAYVGCPPGVSAPCLRRTLFKLAAADGSVLWRRDEAVHNAYEVELSPMTLSVFGGDVVVPGGASFEAAAATRISGVDGSILWTAPTFFNCCRNQPFERIDEQHILIRSLAYLSPTSATLHWAAIDVATGALAWSSSTAVESCHFGNGCGESQSVVLSNGDLVQFRQRDYATYLWRLHNDGSGLFDEWPVEPASPLADAWIQRVVLDEAGMLRAVLRRYVRNHYGLQLAFMAQADPTSGTLSHYQALYASESPAIDASMPALLGASANERALAHTGARISPAPLTEGIALLDIHATARGNLAASIDAELAHVSEGDALVVHLRASYEGDQPVTGIRLVGSDAWAGGVRDAICTTLGATNCMLDLRTGNVVATFDAAPGAEVDVMFTIDVPAGSDERDLVAMTHGPLGLVEEDTLDNIARTSVMQSLFVDGFDAMP